MAWGGPTALPKYLCLLRAGGTSGVMRSLKNQHAMNTTVLLQNTLNGLAIGGIYAIFALGYTLIFSILRIINFAHAAIFTLAAYFTYALTGSRFPFNGLLAKQDLPFGLPVPPWL